MGVSSKSNQENEFRILILDSTHEHFRTPVHDVDAPFFLKKPPLEITVKEGDPLTLTAMVDGDPKPAGTTLNRL